MKTILLVITAVCMLGVAYSIKCDGRRNLKQGRTISCMNVGNEPDIEETQSCLVGERHQSDRHCIANSCTEINIMLDSDSEYEDSENLIWSFSSCFKPEMEIRICAPGYTSAFTSTTEFRTSEEMSSTTEGNTTTSETTTTPTTTSEITSSTTTSGNLTSTTTAQLSSSTTSQPQLEGCYIGEVKFGCPQCEEKEVEVELEDESGVRPNIDVVVQVVGCCSEPHCKIDASEDEDNKCYYGKNNDLFSVSCSSECYGYVYVDADGNVTSLHGCLSDLPLSKISPYEPTECTYEDGNCQHTTNATACMRCCDSANCNSWTTVNEILGIEPTDEPSAARLLLPSLIVLLIGYMAPQLLQ